MFNKPTQVLCKRSMVIGDNYYWDDTVEPPVKVPRDNRMLVAGNWYKIIYNPNDSKETFSIIDNQNCVHLFYMYDDLDNHELPRTYSKWFYTPSELLKKKLREHKKKL